MANVVSITVRARAEGVSALTDFKQALISLAPAALPVAAGLTAVAAKTASAATAAGAFTLAVIPQIAAIKKASEEQKSFERSISELPPASQEAADAFFGLKNSFIAWSDALADNTMPVVTKSFMAASAVLPTLNNLIRGASNEFDRLLNLLGGSLAKGAFGRMMDQFSDFTTGALRDFTNGVVHLSRVLSEGKAQGPIAEFIEYARENGPLVKETLGNLSDAIINLIAGMAEAGPVMLTVVNALAGLVAAIPPEFVGTLIQLFAVFKLATGAAALIGALSLSVQALHARLLVLGAAASTAGGGLAGFRVAAVSALAPFKGTIFAAGIIATGIGLSKLAEASRGAAPDLDKMAIALEGLAASGKFSGELQKTFGDLDGLVAKFKELRDQAEGVEAGTGIGFLDSIRRGIKGFTDDIAKGEGSFNALTEDFKAVDEGLAQLAQGGNIQEAEAGFNLIRDALLASGVGLDEINAKFPEFNSALEDFRFEQDLAAESMGLFGEEAIATQEKLDAQRQATDGLRESIFALNDANRDALSAEGDFQKAIDDLAEAALKTGGDISFLNGTIDQTTQEGRDAFDALKNLAVKTEENAAATREHTGSWAAANKVLSEGRRKLVAAAIQMGATKTEANKLADAILGIPNRTIMIRADISQFQSQIAAASARIASESILLGGGRAHGGIVGSAASGGPRGNLTLVGEQGPEIVNLAPGSRVHSNPDTRRMLGEQGNGGGGGPLNIVLQIGEKTIGEIVIDPIRRIVRSKGGNVQAALGA